MALGLLVVVSLFIVGNILTLNTVHQRSLQERVEGSARAPALAEAGVAVVAQLGPGGGGFDYAAFAAQPTPIAGTINGLIDSCDSMLGDYNPASPRLNGDVATNSTGVPSLSLLNGSIKGDAFVGPTGNPATDILVISGAITGAKSTLSSPLALDPVSMPAVSACNELWSSLALDSTDGDSTNDIRALAPGVYCATTVKLIGGNTRLAAASSAGPVQIYVRDYLYAEGTIRGGNGPGGFPLPKNTQFYFAPGGATVPNGVGFSVWPTFSCQSNRACFGRDDAVPGDPDPKLIGTLYAPDGKVLFAR